MRSCLDRPALEGEQAAWPLLDEQDDEDEDEDLAENGAGKGLEELVGDAEGERCDERSPQIADAAEDNDHEAVDDIGLPEIRADIIDLAERDAGNAGNAGAQAESEGIDTGGADAHGARHLPVLRHGAHFEAEA